MITVQYTRIKTNYKSIDDPIKYPPSRALHSFVNMELGYGGQVVDVKDKSITVCTQLLSTTDLTTFSSDSEEEIRPFIEIVGFHLQVSPDSHGVIPQTLKEAMLTNAYELSKKSTLLLTQMGPIVLGASRTKLAILTYLLSRHQDKQEYIVEKFKDLEQLNLEDLVTIAARTTYEGSTIEDALSLL